MEYIISAKSAGVNADAPPGLPEAEEFVELDGE